MSKNRLAAALVWLLLGILFPDAVRASRTVVSTGSPYIVDVWGIESGLPQSSVISIVQTRDGYLWLGTLNGLVRFDGMKFTIFDEAYTRGLNSSRIIHLFEDSLENLWVGTESAGVAMIPKHGEILSFDLGRGTTAGRLVATCEDGNGTVWLLTRSGLLGRYQGGLMNTAAAGCKTLLAETSGRVWIGTDQFLAALQQTPPNAPAFLLQETIQGDSRLDFALASRNGGFWRLADGRIQKWKGTVKELDWGIYPWGTTPVMAACEDLEGNLIVGTYGRGVYWFDRQGKWTHLSTELSHSSILSLAIDHEGNLWIGTNGGGLNRVKRKVFNVLPGSEGLVVQSVSEEARGGLWVGYNGESRVDYRKGGITQTFKMVADPGLAPNCDVKSVFVDRNQRVWAGAWFSGDSRQLPTRLFQFQDGTFLPVGGSGVDNQDVSVIFQDRKGTLWLGTQLGLARSDPGGWKLFTRMDGLPGNEVRAIAEDAEGQLWIATGSGLARMRDGVFTAYYKKDGLPSEDLSCLYFDGDGVLWVGTRGSGLARFYANRWTHFTTRNGLNGNSISYLVEDGQGNLWIGSNAGLMRVARKSFNDYARGLAKSVVSRAYVEADGLPTRECTQGSQPAACRTADGTLWFPTARGLVTVHPEALPRNTYQPPVIIESVLVDGAEQFTNNLRAAPATAIVVPPGREHLEIHYTSLNLGAAEQSRFRHRLLGHETAWNEVGNSRMVTYIKLPPGEYRFRIEAANEDGVWNPTGAEQVIRVKPPFWRTGWFLGLVITGFLGLIVGFVYYFSTQKLQRELTVFKQHEELEKERGRIARDLHDQLGANLMQVALLADLAGADKDLPGEVEEHAQQISQTARETTKALDEIVWAINPSNDTLDGLINYICKYAQEYYELAGLRYRIEVPPDLPKLTIAPEVRHNVFLAAKEAVNNVVKHAQASSAWLRLNLEPERFTIEIEDNGRGLAGAEQKTGRNGLRNMRKRLEDVGGSFTISPAPEKGAVVRLSAPIKNG